MREPLKVSHYPTKSSDHTHYGIGDLIVLGFHMIIARAKGHVPLYLGVHQGKLSSCQVWWPWIIW